MQTERHREVPIIGRDGLRGTAHLPGNGGAADRVPVHLEDLGDLLVPVDRLRPRADGGYELLLGREEAARYRSATPPDTVRTVPVAEERLRVAKKQIEDARVLVKKTVHEHPQVVDVPLRREQVDVERVPVNRYVDAPVEVRQEGDVTIIPVLEEVLVVEKKLLLREEVRITRHRSSERQPQSVVLSREEVEVERTEPRTEGQAAP